MTQEEFAGASELHIDMVYRIALNSLRSAADAEDAAQETMLRLWRTDTAFTSAEHLRSWLVRVCVNVCRDMARSPWHRRRTSLEACAEPVFQEPTHGELWREVMALAPKYRLPLYLYYYEGYSAAEVGSILGLNVSTVRTRLARGRAKLKTQLEE